MELHVKRFEILMKESYLAVAQQSEDLKAEYQNIHKIRQEVREQV